MGANHNSLDRLFEVLTEHRRRYVLYYLDRTDDPVVTVADLADQLCTWERDWDDQTEQPSNKHQENIRIDLHHVHLPKLGDAGLIDYDARSQTLHSRLGESLVDAVQEREDECPRLEALFTNAEANS